MKAPLLSVALGLATACGGTPPETRSSRPAIPTTPLPPRATVPQPEAASQAHRAEEERRAFAAQRSVAKEEATRRLASIAGPRRIPVPPLWPTDLRATFVYDYFVAGHDVGELYRLAFTADSVLCYRQRTKLSAIRFALKSTEPDERVPAGGWTGLEGLTSVHLHGHAAPGEAPTKSALYRLSEERARAVAKVLRDAGVKVPIELHPHGADLSAATSEEARSVRPRVEVSASATPSDYAVLVAFEGNADLAVWLRDQVLAFQGRPMPSIGHHVPRAEYRLDEPALKRSVTPGATRGDDPRSIGLDEALRELIQNRCSP